MEEDRTKELLEQLLANLYEKQRESPFSTGESYLEAQNSQYLGKITPNEFDSNSLLNEYGPYGSPYSTTSIFNEYSDYGSPYGSNSVKNAYCASPPKLFVNGQLLGFVTVNPYVADGIATEAFLHILRNDLGTLLSGGMPKSMDELRQLRRESYIEGGDGTFLGKLNPNRFDQESIFNTFGMYGSKFSPDSIFNRFSTYGNQFNSLSPYNQFSTNPPKLYLNGEFVGFLTKNKTMRPRVDPDELLSWAERRVRRFG